MEKRAEKKKIMVPRHDTLYNRVCRPVYHARLLEDCALRATRYTLSYIALYLSPVQSR